VPSLYRLTVKEIFRKRFLLIALVLLAVFLTVYALGLGFSMQSFEGSSRMLRELFAAQITAVALYMASFISAFLVVFSAAGSLASEIEGEELQAVVSRPVHRWEVVAGKYLGLATVCICFNLLMLLVIMGVSRLITGEPIRRIGSVIALFSLHPLVLLSLTTLASVFLKTLTAGITGILVFMIGVIGGMVEQIGSLAGGGPAVGVIGLVSRLIVPTDALYRFIYASLTRGDSGAVAAAGPFGTALQPGSWMVGYAAAYSAVFFLLTVFAFSRKDL
jgi:ABC-type transport system involved in multi-copper enzyme maturation permease subunit